LRSSGARVIGFRAFSINISLRWSETSPNCSREVEFTTDHEQLTTDNELQMSTISTHILDIARGAPASGVAVSLAVQNTDESWTELSHASTDTDGRVKPFFLVGEPIERGTYRLVFDTEAYFSSLNVECFYPQVAVVFRVEDAAQHYHIPLLLSPYGYSTYRGS
jgi:5-hydroxyisourate hydrolase